MPGGRPPAGGHIRLFPNHSTPYRLIRVGGRQRLEHRVIMEHVLGRPLTRKEIVHHRDGNGLNNDPINLEVMSQAVHMRTHIKRHWSIEEAATLRAQGWTMARIAAHFDRSSSSIRKSFIRHGIGTRDLRWGHRRWDTRRAKSMRQAGNSFSAIARTMRISVSTVTKFFRQLSGDTLACA